MKAVGANEIKIKKGTLLDPGFQRAFAKLMDFEEYGDQKILRKMVKVQRNLMALFNKVDDQRLVLLEGFAKKDENGAVVKKADGSAELEDAAAWSKAWIEFKDESVKFSGHRIPVRCIEMAKISPAALDLIEPVIDFPISQ